MVKIVNAPGYEDFEANLIMEVLSVTGELMSILDDPETKEIFVIPSRYIDEGDRDGC